MSPIRHWLIAITAIVAGAHLEPVQAVETLGFVLSGWHMGLYQTPDGKAECPDGFHAGNRANWDAQFGAQRDDELKRRGNWINRGAHDENVFFYPWSTEDPLPLREARSKVAYGLNLDGTTDGRETDRTCPHEKFAGPQGEAGIDNQFYRVFGCQPVFRKGGVREEGYNSNNIKNQSSTRILVEIAGVDDPVNDDEVQITFYKGIDLLATDALGRPIPWQSQRIDRYAPEYVQRTRGRISNAILTTDPVDVRWPEYAVGVTQERRFKGMRLQIKLTDETAEGVLGGYLDIDQWFLEYYAVASMLVQLVGDMSAPAQYQGMLRLADGDKDPETGRCRAISTAYRVEFTRALIVRDDAGLQASSSTGSRPARPVAQ